MPKINDSTPKGLKLYEFHGIDFNSTSGGDEQRIAECPFCGKHKFHANIGNGLWDCKVCGENGNQYTFMRKLWELGIETTFEDDYLDLMLDRGILSPESLTEWGICKSPITSEWLLPAYSWDGKLSQLYKFVPRPNSESWMTIASPRVDVEGESEVRHQLFGANLIKKEHSTILICEGYWDGVILWETLAKFTQGKMGPRYTEKITNSYLSHVGVVAVPGSQGFRQAWCPLFSGKEVVFLFDNDHPRKHERTGHDIPPSGLTGTKKAIEVLYQATESPKSFKFLRWGLDGYNLKEPNGLDVRDLLCEYPSIKARGTGLGKLLSLIHSVPSEWIQEVKDRLENACKAKHCNSFPVLLNAWKRAMKWTRGLDSALVFCMAIAASTDVPGDQLWGKLIGPPSSGKSTLAEALSVSKRHVHASSTLKGFYSGYKTDKEGTEDHSLIKKIKDKTLIIKDGDTLLQNPNRDVILAQARDLYDRVSRSDYSNALNRTYEGYNVTFILCGTSSLRQLDTSELGQRFLDCIIMDEISEELEGDINRRKINQIRTMMGHLNNGQEIGRDGETKDMMEAKALTAGYIEYLRSKSASSTSGDSIPKVREILSSITMSDEHADDCNMFGQFVAYFRSRPSKKQDEEKKTRELSTRLVSQITTMAFMIAAVLQKKEVDQEVMNRLHKITLDTARGNTLHITRHIVNSKDKGLEYKAVATLVGLPDERTKELLRFLKSNNVLETFKPQLSRGVSGNIRYRLADRMRILYFHVTNYGRD
jgi:hypothetical protein